MIEHTAHYNRRGLPDLAIGIREDAHGRFLIAIQVRCDFCGDQLQVTEQRWDSPDEALAAADGLGARLELGGHVEPWSE